jgi:hypothetical protein
MDEIQTTIAEDITIERCRELLADEADGLSDEDIARVGRHAAAFARILIELFLEQRFARALRVDDDQLAATRERV